MKISEKELQYPIIPIMIEQSSQPHNEAYTIPPQSLSLSWPGLNDLAIAPNNLTHSHSLIGCHYNGKQFYLVHLDLDQDSTGREMRKLMVNTFKPMFRIMPGRKVLVLKMEVLGNRLLVWDLDGYCTFQLELNDIWPSNTTQIFVFHETQTVCLAKIVGNSVNVSYFQFCKNSAVALVKIASKVIYIDFNQNNNLKVVQIDNCNKLAVFGKGFYEKFLQIRIKIVSLGQQIKAQTRMLNLDSHYVSDVKFKISDMWSIKQDIIYCQLEYYLPRQMYCKTIDLYWHENNSKPVGSKLSISQRHRFHFLDSTRNISIDLTNSVEHQVSLYVISYDTRQPGSEQIVSTLTANPGEKEKVYPIHCTATTFMTYNFSMDKKEMEVLTWPIQPFWHGYGLTCVNFMEQLIQDCDQDLLFRVQELLKDNPYPMCSLKK